MDVREQLIRDCAHGGDFAVKPVGAMRAETGRVLLDPRTMESKLVPHLYFAGEVMDIDGPTGGYNLTMAFATARMAVTAIRDEGRGTRDEG